MTANANLTKNFPELRIDQLKRSAERWVDKYPTVPIGKIVLYHYSTLRPDVYEKMQAKKEIAPAEREKHPVRYAVVFELVDSTTSALEMFEDGKTDFDWDVVQFSFKKMAVKKLPEEEVYRIARLSIGSAFLAYLSLVSNGQIQRLLIPPAPSSKKVAPIDGTILERVLSHDRIANGYDKLLRAISLYDGHKGFSRYPELLDTGFTNVYKSSPENGEIYKDWRFFVLEKGSELPAGIKNNEPSTDLFNLERPIKQAEPFTGEQTRRFDELNLFKMADSAFVWCHRFCFIESVALHRSMETSFKYILFFKIYEFFDKWETTIKEEFWGWRDWNSYGDNLRFELSKNYDDKKSAENINNDNKKSAEDIDIDYDWFIPKVNGWEDIKDYVIPGKGVLLAWRGSVGDTDTKKVNYDPIASEWGKKTKIELPDTIKTFLQFICKSKEVEKIYGAIKVEEGFGEQTETANSTRRENAIAFYEEHAKEFEYIKKQDVAKEDIYKLGGGGPTVTIKGRLIQAVVSRMFHQKHSFQKMYSYYQECKNKQL